MNPEKTALVLVDCQNDFLSKDGKLYGAVESELKRHDVIAHLNAAIDAAHQADVPVIFTSIVFSEGYPEMGEEPYGIFPVVKGAGAFIRGSWGADIAEALHKEQADLVLEKNTMCAFKSTDLEEILKKQGIKSIAFGGLVANLCLETTVRSAYDKGFEAYTLTDCIAALDPSAHDNTVVQNFPQFSKPVTHAEFMAALAGEKIAT